MARWIESQMQEPWHRDLIAGMTAEHGRDLEEWAEGMARTYSRSGSLEVTAVIWALLDALDAAPTGPEPRTDAAVDLAREICDLADKLDGDCGCADPLFDRAQELAPEYVAQRYGRSS